MTDAAVKKDSALKKKVPRYQTFPDQEGGSQSDEKLKQLRLPSLRGQSFMDVGCNEGFFCGFASFEGATRVVGLDMNAGFLERARERFPGCEFLNQSWDKLPDEKFDVVLLASALHYARDQAQLIHNLMAILNPAGTLVLEIGVVDSSENAWVPVKRSIDERFFATWSKLKEVLEPYAWKNMGASVRQAGDPVNRVVIHVHHRLPMAYLLMMPPAFGKTFISNALFGKAQVPVVQGDLLLDSAAKGKIPAPEKMKTFLDQTYAIGEMVRIIKEINAADLMKTYMSMVTEAAGPGDFAFDGYVPPVLQEKVKATLRDMGYLPIVLNWEQVGILPARLDRADERVIAYKQFLTTGEMPTDMAPMRSSPKSAPAPQTGMPLSARLLKRLRRPFGSWARANSLQQRWKTEGTLGHVDSLKVSGRVVTIGGWAINEAGMLPPVFVIRFGNTVFEKREVRRQDRPDVQKQLLNRHTMVGFELEIYVDQIYKPDQLAERIEVSAGETPETQCAPFKLARRLLAQHS